MQKLMLQVVTESGTVIGSANIEQTVTKPKENGKGGGKPCWKSAVTFVPPSHPALRVTAYLNGVGYDPEKRAARSVGQALKDLEFATPDQLAEMEAKIAALREGQ